ncbi:MAG: 16S rRNA processing protein RimM [Magnetococcales bacterium]|nr:16S rRNA processing protein RimM [Magnetococcales bacterium]
MTASREGAADDLWLHVGRIIGPFGIKGAVKIDSSLSRPADIGQWDRWWLGTPTSEKVATRVLWCQTRARTLVAGLESSTCRDDAIRLAGMLLWVPRSLLPVCAEGEYYWSELVGMAVRDRSGRVHGRVDHLFATGAHDILVIAASEGKELLVPFVAEFVDHVDRRVGLITINPLPGMLEA